MVESNPIGILVDVEYQISTIDLRDVSTPSPLRVFVIFDDQNILSFSCSQGYCILSGWP
jgi:hypothetical protein